MPGSLRVRSLLACVLLCTSAFAQTGPAPVPPTAVPESRAAVDTPPAADGAQALTGTDVTAWLDGFMPYALARGNIAGGVVTVVKDGEIIAKRGYGYADVAKRQPVDPDATLFRPGSVSKLLTWTAVMQQVEAGRLDLDADINDYLDFRVPTRGTPITLRHLMTHTSGLEERVKNLMTTEAQARAGKTELGAYLKAWVPGQIFEPGSVPAYSNYATSLAGYIVARVSGESFDDYIERHVLQPLRMTRSSFRQPLPDELAGLMSRGYKLASDEPGGYEVVPSAPAGALAATGSDMARFMIAHLETAAGRDSPLLKAATAAQMYTPQTRFVSPLRTMALGFYEIDLNGQRVLGHGGDTIFFHSYLYLFRDQGVGVFVSVNSTGADGATGVIRSELLEGFADRYFPAQPPQPVQVDLETAKAQARLLAAGHYLNSRRSESGFMRLMQLQQVQLVDHGDGSVGFPMFSGTDGQPSRFYPVAPFVWRTLDGKQRLAAVVEAGEVTAFSVDAISPFMLFQRVEGYRSGAWLVPVLGVSFAVLVLSALAWPLSALVRRRYRLALPWPPRTVRAYRASRAASWLVLVSWVGWIGLIAWFMADYFRINDGLNGGVLALSALSVVAIAAGVATSVWNLRETWRGGRGWPARLWAGLLLIAMLATSYAAVISGLVAFVTDF
ncbi:serine hydrolase [Luteimonas sp. TWI1416]|uniref:serine hydrolase domain-containing protein n=1 Tax=unclassified Luteimonas TaxID=2629088 RepID=UPI003208E703